MKKVFLSCVIALMMFYMVSPALGVSAAIENELQDGEYEIGLTVLEDGKGNPSVMDGYTQKPVKLFVKGGNYKAHITFTHSSWIKEFSVENNGTFVDSSIVSTDDTNNTRVVEIPVETLTGKINAKTHVYIPPEEFPGGGTYDNHYTIQLQFDISSLKVISLDEQAEEPEEDIPDDDQGAPEEEVETPGDDQGAPEEEVETPGEDQTISLENGTYSMDLEAWHNEEDKLSSMDKYLAKPVQLDVDGNRRLITLTIKNQSQMKSFQVEQNGAFIDAKVLGTDEEADTRTVQFAYPELSKPLQAKVGVQVGSYGNTYDLRLVAKTDSIQKITDEEEPADPEPETPDEEVKQPDDPELQKPNPETPPVSNKELQDGRYHIDVKVLKDGTNEISVMQDYIVSPAELDVKDGNSQILLTLKNSSWITMLQVMQEGEYKDVKVEKMNAKQDTSVVSFFVEDLSKKLDGKVKVDIDALNYHNKYNVQFQFDKDSIRKLGEKPDNQNNNGKLPIQKNDPNSNHQGKNGNSNDINKTDDDDNNLNYDRNSDQLKPKQTNNNQLGSTNRGAGTNPQTGDLSGIGVYILLMAASMIVVIRKWRAGTF